MNFWWVNQNQTYRQEREGEYMWSPKRSAIEVQQATPIPSASGRKDVHMNTYIWGISGVTVAGGVGVIIDSKGHLGTVVSSERFKDEIKPMDRASEAILALRPVTF